MGWQNFVRAARRAVRTRACFGGSIEREHTPTSEVKNAMERFFSEVGALYTRVRRPAISIGLGLVLMLPAGGMILSGETEPLPEMDPASLARADTPMAARLAAAKAVDGSVAAAWREKALERTRDDVAERFAREFGISSKLARQIHDAAVAARIEPRVAFGLVRTESSFRRTAVSWAGAVGYTQLLPSTAAWMEPGTKRSDLFDTETNLRIGFKYLRYLLDKYDGDLRLALTAYNRGPGTVDRLLAQGRNPENGYADKVLS